MNINRITVFNQLPLNNNNNNSYNQLPLNNNNNNNSYNSNAALQPQ